jgi:hypothetical protein
MPTDPKADDPVEKFLSDTKQIEARRQELIRDLLQQKEAAIRAFDEKLARLGHKPDRPAKRSHHRTAVKQKGS